MAEPKVDWYRDASVKDWAKSVSEGWDVWMTDPSNSALTRHIWVIFLIEPGLDDQYRLR